MFTDLEIVYCRKYGFASSVACGFVALLCVFKGWYLIVVVLFYIIIFSKKFRNQGTNARNRLRTKCLNIHLD